MKVTCASIIFFLKTENDVYPSSPWLAVSNPVELLTELNIDLCYIGLGKSKDTPVFEYGMDHYTDEWGVKFRKIENPLGLHYDFYDPVFPEPSVDDVENYPWPDPNNPELTAGLDEKARNLYEDTDFALIGKFSNSIFEQAFYMRGFENFLMDISDSPRFC